MIDFNYNNIRSYDSVLVLGGGPSLTSSMNLIQDFIKKENPVILSANYEHKNINIDFIHFVTSSKFREAYKQKIKTKNIILRDKISYLSNNNIGYNYYKIGNNKSESGAYKIKKIQISNNGDFNYFNLGNAGFSTIVISAIFKPKKIFMVGFDGPFSDYSKKLIYKNEIKYYNKSFTEKRGVLKKKYFNNVIIPFLLSKNIKIYSSKKDKLWGISRDNIYYYG